MNRLAILVAAVLLGALTACAGGSPAAPAPVATSVTSISIGDIDRFAREFTFAVPQLRDASDGDLQKIVNGICSPTGMGIGEQALLYRLMLGATEYQRDSFYNSALTLCKKAGK